MLKKIRNNNPCEIKKGDIVTRKSYGQDILFLVKKVIYVKGDNIIAILKGCTLRIEASAPISDLVRVDKMKLKNAMDKLDSRIENRIEERKNLN